MTKIDSNTIIIKPINSYNDTESTRVYRALMLRVKRAGIILRKHVLDNEVPEATKTVIQDEYKMETELVPPGSHHHNATEVAIRNFRAHFLSVLARVADDFQLHLWDRLLPQTEVTISLL